MSWHPPTELELADGSTIVALTILKVVALVARTALERASGDPCRERLAQLLLVQLGVLDAAIDQYRRLAHEERLLREDDLLF